MSYSQGYSVLRHFAQKQTVGYSTIATYCKALLGLTCFAYKLE